MGMGQARTPGGPAEADHRLWEPTKDSPVTPQGTTYIESIGFGAIGVAKPYEFIWFGAMGVTKPYEFTAAASPPEEAAERMAIGAQSEDIGDPSVQGWSSSFRPSPGNGRKLYKSY